MEISALMWNTRLKLLTSALLRRNLVFMTVLSKQNISGEKGVVADHLLLAD